MRDHLAALLCRIDAADRSEIESIGGVNALKEYDNALKFKKNALFVSLADRVQFRRLLFADGMWALLAYVKNGSKYAVFVSSVYESTGNRSTSYKVSKTYTRIKNAIKKRGRKRKTYVCPCCAATVRLEKGVGLVED